MTLWLVGAVPAHRCLIIVTAQILGGIAAAGVSSGLLPGPFPANVRLGGGTSVVQGLFIEMFTTTMLVMTVIMLAAVKSRSTWLAPIGIGIALFIGHLMSMYIRNMFGYRKEAPTEQPIFAQVSITPAQASTRSAHLDLTLLLVPFPAITGSTGSVRFWVRCWLPACGTCSRRWAGKLPTQGRTTMIWRHRLSTPRCIHCDQTFICLTARCEMAWQPLSPAAGCHGVGLAPGTVHICIDRRVDVACFRFVSDGYQFHFPEICQDKIGVECQN